MHMGRWVYGLLENNRKRMRERERETKKLAHLELKKLWMALWTLAKALMTLFKMKRFVLS